MGMSSVLCEGQDVEDVATFKLLECISTSARKRSLCFVVSLERKMCYSRLTHGLLMWSIQTRLLMFEKEPIPPFDMLRFYYVQINAVNKCLYETYAAAQIASRLMHDNSIQVGH